MSAHSSGYYSIDSDYNIVGFNATAKQIYPSLQIGVKCYKALMGLDSPCPPCPVANGICGPRTYLDPIRHIYETVDAVETVYPDGSRGHALVFSTVAEGERLSGSIPTGESSLRLLGAINLLAAKYTTVFGVNLNTARISVYRSERLFGRSEIVLPDKLTYEEALEQYILRYVHPQERRAIREQLELGSLRARLDKTSAFKVHFCVPEEQMHYYYLLIARNGEANDYEDIVMALACEDDDINTRRIYEKQLDSLISSLTHCPGYFHLDITEDRILRAGGNSAFVDMLNASCPINELMRSMASYIPSPKDRQAFLSTYRLDAMKQAYEAGQVEVIRESRCLYDDNVARWSRYTVRLFMNPSNYHLEGVFFGRDITQDRQAYETQISIIQSLSSNYHEVLLLNTREKTAFVIKHEGRFPVDWEKGFGPERPYDMLREGYIQTHVHPEDRDAVTGKTGMEHVMRELADKKEYAGNYRTLQDGQEHYYQYRFIKDEEYGTVVLGLMNVDSIVAAEIEHQQTLKKALDEAKRASMEKSRFLARMSHDMRTPLNGIIGLLEIDKKHENDIALMRENRRKAFKVTRHLVSLINDVLDMAKIEEGSLVLAHDPFDLMEESRDAAVLINLQAQERGIQTIVHMQPIDKELGYIYGSPLHLRRALMNIYSNCIKYNREHGTITTTFETVSYDEKTVTFRWTIEDTGIGMSQEFLEQIFEPFVQENMDARSVYQGTGLGMSIAKAIIEQMGGTLEVSSRQNVGSTFVVTIPFDRAREEEIAMPEQARTDSIRGMRLLLVEDNDLNREIAQTLLEDEGAVVTSAVNGREAVEAVMAHPDAYDLVLMDVMMPVMDGYEATRTLRQQGMTLPIIAMTANAFAEDVQRSAEAGMNDHIAKPLDLGKLLRTLARYNRRTAEDA